MDVENITKQLAYYNSLYKNLDEVYHVLARYYGLSDSAFWILYLVRESEDAHTQNKICQQLSLSKQTVNSALKKLEKDGYIRLEHFPDNQKNKRICLTDKGNILAEESIKKVALIEQNAFGQFTPEERSIFLNLFETYVNRLQDECRQITAAEKRENTNYENYND